MARPPKPPLRDPLLEAAIAKLPRAGEFTAEQRADWLRMMAMIFDQVYGRVETSPPLFIPPTRLMLPNDGTSSPVGFISGRGDAAAKANGKPAPLRPHLYIGRDGMARRHPTDDPIMSHEAKGTVLYDRRGEQGDLASITWADGSMGVLGLQIEVSASDPF